MAKIVVSRETLLDMAGKCAHVSERMKGTPVLDDAAELLETAAHHVAHLEERLRRWEDFGETVRERIPNKRD